MKMVGAGAEVVAVNTAINKYVVYVLDLDYGSQMLVLCTVAVRQRRR